jgi:uncharacterized protein (DUF697 family)
MKTPRTIRFSNVMTLTAVTSLLIVSCGGEESTSSEPTSTAITSDLAKSMLQIPEDWPVEVPVVGGGIAVSTATGVGQAKTWVLEFYSDDLAKTWSDAQAQLNSAGFEMISSETLSNGDIDSVFQSDKFTVMTKIYIEADTQEKEIRYVVSQNG